MIIRLRTFLKVGFQFNGARMLPADSKQVLNALRATPIAPVYNNEYGLYTALPEFQKAQIKQPDGRRRIESEYYQSGELPGIR